MKPLIALICVVRFFSCASARSINATHVDIPNETQIVYATPSSENTNWTNSVAAVVNSTAIAINLLRSKDSNDDDNRPVDRSSKSLVSGYKSNYYHPVNVRNYSDQSQNVNIDSFNPFPDQNLPMGKSTGYILEPKYDSKVYKKSHPNHLATFASHYNRLSSVSPVEVSNGYPSSVKPVTSFPMRYNTNFPTLNYIPETAEYNMGIPQYSTQLAVPPHHLQPTPPPPHITYTYPYVMDKQMEVLHTFKSLSESLFSMIYEIYFCMRHYWQDGMMKCMTGRSTLFGDRSFHDDGDDVDGDLKEESRIFHSDLTPEDPTAVATPKTGVKQEEEEPRQWSWPLTSLGVGEDKVNATPAAEQKLASRGKKPDYGGAVSAFSSGLGSGIGNGVSHQVFTYQMPKKKKKKKKKHGHGHHGHGHGYKHILPYIVAAKAKLLSILTIVGFLAKKAWIVSTISLLLSLLSLFAKLTSKGTHRSTEVILAKPSLKDWDWDRDWEKMDESESRVKPSAYRLVPVEENTPIPLHYYEKENDKDFYA